MKLNYSEIRDGDQFKSNNDDGLAGCTFTVIRKWKRGEENFKLPFAVPENEKRELIELKCNGIPAWNFWIYVSSPLFCESNRVNA